MTVSTSPQRNHPFGLKARSRGGGTNNLLNWRRAFLIFAALLFSKTVWPMHVCVPDTDSPPFITHNGHEGLSIGLLKSITANKHLALYFDILSRPLCLSLLKYGETDAVLGLAYGASTRDMGAFPPDSVLIPNADYALAFAEVALFRRTGDSPDFDGREFLGLHGNGLVVQYGQPTIVDFINTHGERTTYEVKTFEQAFKMLVAERVDGAALLGVSADAALAAEAQYQKRIERVSTPLANSPTYLVFSKKFFQEHPAVAQTVWEAIRMAPALKKYGKNHFYRPGRAAFINLSRAND